MILCADDFGIAKGVSAGILQLIEAKRITATSCMVHKETSLNDGFFQDLKTYSNQIDIGLHLVLTLQKAKSLQAQIEDQLARFRQIFHRDPDFVDGHQHKHQMFGVANRVTDTLMKNIESPYYVRNGSCAWRQMLQLSIDTQSKIGAFAIGLLGHQFRVRLHKNQIMTNPNLWGYWSTKTHFADFFEAHLEIPIAQNDIFFVHPGLVDSELIAIDKLTSPREEVLTYLHSNRFQNLVDQQLIKLNRFKNGSRCGAPPKPDVCNHSRRRSSHPLESKTLEEPFDMGSNNSLS
jgi:predicted glycoside hydrolase/deacetylase ChbG (UPF0249 family)